MTMRSGLWRSLGALMVVCTLGGGADAQTPLYGEDFNDDLLAANTTQLHGTISGGLINIDDQVATSKARVSVVQTMNDPIMTFSVDIKAPVTGANNDLLFRSGIGTGADMLLSGDQMFEVILHRDAGNRGTYTNNGNESLFVVVNNKDSALTFPSPIAAAPDVTVNPFTYITYLRNNVTSVFTTMKGATAMVDKNAADPGVGVMTRFAVGNSGDNRLGTFALDNLLVMSGVSFDQVIPPQGVPGDVDGDEDVDMDDFAIIQSHFQQTVATREEGDLTFDDVVDFRDFRQWKTNAPAEVIAEWAALGVPEPSTAVLAGLALAAGVAARRRKR